jgi:hypothetical protein
MEVTIGDESRIQVNGKGSVEIPLESGVSVIFRDVLYSAHFGANSLISVPKTDGKGS